MQQILTGTTGIYRTIDQRVAHAAQWAVSHVSSKVVFVTALFVTAAIIFLRIPQPLHGDTALFVTFARGMAEGDVLYRDLWDIKPPGIMTFYYIGGNLFGFHPYAMRAFEVLWHLGLLAGIMTLLRPYFRSPTAFALLPLFYVGGYYAMGTSGELGQAESVASPLLAILTLTALRSFEGKNALVWAIISGLTVGVACLFKPVFALVAISVWGTLGVLWFRRKELLSFIVRGGLAAAASLVPLFLSFAIFAAHGALEAYLTVLFVEPFTAYPPGPANWVGLRDALSWMVRFVPGFSLGVIAAILTTRWSSAEDRMLILVTLAWIVGVAAAIGVQTNSWWPYHFVMLFLPFTMMTSIGLDRALSTGRATSIAIAAVGFSFVPYLVLYRPLFAMVETGFPVTRVERDAYGFALGDTQSRIPEQVDDIPPFDDGALQDEPIFVFGNPIMYWRSGGLQASRIQGWCPELFKEDIWRDLGDGLVDAAPRVIFIGQGYRELIDARTPELARMLDDEYEIIRETSDLSHWYVRKSAP